MPASGEINQGDIPSLPAKTSEVALQFSGIRLVFWSEFTRHVLVNAYCFLIPFVVGYLHWSNHTMYRLLSVSQAASLIAGIVSAVGVFRLTRFETKRFHQVFLRCCVLTEVYFRARLATQFTGLVWPHTVAFWLSRHVLYAALIFATFKACSRLLRGLGDPSRPQILNAAGGTLATAALFTSIGRGYLRNAFEMDQGLIDMIGIGIFAAAGIWGLAALWRAAEALRFVMNKKCITCGYDLTGLRSRHCPECNTEIGFRDNKNPNVAGYD